MQQVSEAQLHYYSITMHRLLTFFAVWLLAHAAVFAGDEVPTQTIKGRVLDIASHKPIAAAKLTVIAEGKRISALSDAQGNYRLERVPVGRQAVNCIADGYDPYISPSIILTSAKEFELNIELEEMFGGMLDPTQAVKGPDKTFKEHEKAADAGKDEKPYETATVEILATRSKDKPVNEFSLIGARSFTTEQVQRYPNTFNDPGRMAMAYPGVEQLASDAADILVRGNSPMGVSWRLEGVEIFAPNHFSRPGTSGGGISIFSLSLLGTSDFVMGGFAPEYGNTTAGVFDMHFREGNKNQQEYTFRAGIIGLDLATEGPIRRGKSSYLANYRYSTLGILDRAGFHLTDPNTRNEFQDLSYNVVTDIGKKGKLTFFGLGGYSHSWNPREGEPAKWTTRGDRMASNSQTFAATMGASYTHTLDDKSYVYVVLSGTGSLNHDTEDTVNTALQPYETLTEIYQTIRYTAYAAYNRKISTRLTLKTGLYGNLLMYNYVRNFWDFNNLVRQYQFDSKGATQSWQPYAQMHFRANGKLTFVGGFNVQHLALNKTTEFDPRLSAEYKLTLRQTVSLSVGKYSQMLPLGDYFYRLRDAANRPYYPNMSLEMLKSIQGGLAYSMVFPGDFRVRAESYYQYYYRVPVNTKPNDTYTLLNRRWNYTRDVLENSGTWTNKGVELTVDKFFSKTYFFLAGVSLFNSTYTNREGKVFEGNFNRRYSFKFMANKEIPLGNAAIELGLRSIYAGGFPDTPFSVDAQGNVQRDYFNDYNATHLPAFWRIDTRFALRWSLDKADHVIALDIQNVTNHQNAMQITDFDAVNRKQLYYRNSGFAPILSYVLNF